MDLLFILLRSEDSGREVFGRLKPGIRGIMIAMLLEQIAMKHFILIRRSKAGINVSNMFCNFPRETAMFYFFMDQVTQSQSVFAWSNRSRNGNIMKMPIQGCFSAQGSI